MALNISTTTTANEAFAPDKTAFTPEQAVNDALIMRATTVVDNEFAGDEPVIRVPWISEHEATFTAEGAQIEQTQPKFAQTEVHVSKITNLTYLSREMWYSTNPQNPTILSNSVMRSMIRKADQSLLTSQATGRYPLIGLSNTEGVVTGGNITTALDPLADTIAQLEANGATPALILANPLAWGKLRNLKTGKDANTALLGAGTEDQGKKLFGIEVITNAAVPEDQLVVIDPTAIPSVAGPVEVATSEHALFDHDSIAIRATWHIGWSVMHADRIGSVTVGASSK